MEINHQLQYMVIDNFFGDRLSYLLPYLKNQPHYSRSKHPVYTPEEDSNWPGVRSREMLVNNPPMFSLFADAMPMGIPYNSDSGRVTLYTHFRYDDNSPDWIHQDGTPITTIVYLSETNLNSGTGFYDGPDGNLILDVPFVQNRAVIFHGNVWHGSKGNYGTTKDDARFTMNFFSHVPV